MCLATKICDTTYQFVTIALVKRFEWSFSSTHFFSDSVKVFGYSVTLLYNFNMSKEYKIARFQNSKVEI